MQIILTRIEVVLIVISLIVIFYIAINFLVNYRRAMIDIKIANVNLFLTNHGYVKKLRLSCVNYYRRYETIYFFNDWEFSTLEEAISFIRAYTIEAHGDILNEIN